MVQDLTKSLLRIDQSKKTGKKQVAGMRVEGEERRKSRQRENRNVYTEICLFNLFYLFIYFSEQNILGKKM